MRMGKDTNSTVLVLGNYRQTVTVVRSLARAGYRVILGDEGWGVAQYSRHVAEVWKHPLVEPVSHLTGTFESQEFTEALHRFLHQRRDIEYLFPVGEDELRVQVYSPAEPPGIVRVMPEPDAVIACLDKLRMYRLAEGTGVPVAPGRVASDRGSVRAAIDFLGYPCVLKPNDAMYTLFGHKAIICHEPGDLARRFPHWPERHDCVIVQKFSPGVRHNCHIAAVDGDVRMYFEQRVLRTDRANGTGYGVDGVSVAPSPVRRRWCEILIAALHYTGVGCVQFLVDEQPGGGPDGVFLEFNPRLDATCALPYLCDHDFPLAALHCARWRHGARDGQALADALQPEPRPYPIGRRMAWALGDLRGLVRAYESGELGRREALRWAADMLATWRHTDHHVAWDVGDPGPSLAMSSRWLRSQLFGPSVRSTVRALFRRFPGTVRSDDP